MPDHSQPDNNAAVLSQVPAIHSFEFDKNAIGNIKSSVNKFRGSVSLPMDFLTVPGREGLDIKLSALYSSNIRNNLNNWNLDAPTSVLGLGWQMPIEMIVVDKAGCRSATSDTYYLVSSGSANPMAKTGETSDGRWIFQLRNFEFWSVQFDPRDQTWTIVKENGFVYTYGAGSDMDSNATQWGVSWGNWIGSSNQRAAQENYPLAWNLVSVVTPLDNKVQYRYQNVNQKVMSNGLEYTQASYLKQIIDSYGRMITFNYGNKYGALNPDNTPDRQPIVEYQARHTQQVAPNAYQDRYETYFLDSVDVSDSDGSALYGIKFTYTFVNHTFTSDSNYSLMYKRCLQSVFQYSPDGETLPAMAFEYVDQTDSINPGALSAIIYPGGGKASFGYKSIYIKSPKKITQKTPLPGGIPRVWFGSNYVVFTYSKEGSSKVIVQSWDGEWVTQDVTGVMGNKTAVSDSLSVLTGENFFAVSFRNKMTGNDELYVFRNDDRGTELRFGTWLMYNNLPFILPLKSKTSGTSTFVAGDNFVIAYNKDYTSGPVQGFSYTWQEGRWNTIYTVPPSSDMQYAAITAYQNYYAVSCYLPDSQQLKNYIFYRDLKGSWKPSESNSWNIKNIQVMTDQDRLYLSVTPMPSGLVLTFVTSVSDTSLDYILNIFDWDQNFHVLNPSLPVTAKLSSPIVGGQSLYQIFRTVVVDSLVNNNLALLRNSGGDQSQASCWTQKLFTAPGTNATVATASGEDTAILCATTGSNQSNQLITFNPNSNNWLTAAVTQTEKNPSISGNYMTVGRNLYYRKTDGTWSKLTTQLGNMYPESMQNRAPQYLAYQDTADGSASTTVVVLKNGGATLLPKLSANKMYVPSGQPGTILAGGRFLVTYPSSSASFEATPSMDLYALDEVNFDQYVVDFPVAYVEIEDAYDSTQSYSQSFFYANSSESQIVYNAATGVTQYPMVSVVPGVKEISELPPQHQPQGRSQFYYSNGLARQTTLYPSGGIQNYQNILNGIELAQQHYDAANTLVSSQLNYWSVYSRDSSGNNLYGGYARCERVVSMKDGVQQQSTVGYDRSTGLMLWQENTYNDAQGVAKRIRTESLYAWQVPEYASVFQKMHMYSSVAMTTESVSLADGSSRTYIQSKATTYRNWADTTAVTVDCKDGNNCRLAAYEAFDWTTPGSTAPQFPSTVPVSAVWELKTRIVSRSEPHGMILEQVDGMGLFSSFIYDRDQAFLVAKFPNGRISGNEVSYYGFESYEEDQGWIIGGGAAITPNPQSPLIDAHTGTKSLSIAPSTTGNNGIVRIFEPMRQDMQYVFSAWIKKPLGFNKSEGNASWKIAVAGGTISSLHFPDTEGQWVYIYQIVSLPDPSGSSQIEIRCENENTQSNVLVDDLRFSPLACPMEAYAYDSKFRQPTSMLGPNGEDKRTVYDSFQQQIFSTNPADRTGTIIKSYFSRSGNQDKFALDDPNHTLTIGSANGGNLTSFTRGSEWKSDWLPLEDAWQVDGMVLTQKEADQIGRLACAKKELSSNYALAIEFDALETLTSPIGIQLGTGLTIQWNPGLTAWQLLNSSGVDIMPQVDAMTFFIPSEPYVTQLDGGKVSPGLCSAFCSAGYLLLANSVVSAGAANGKGWTLTSPDKRYRYALKLEGSHIAVYAMNRHWMLLAGEDTLVFLADGKLIFSYTTPSALSVLPSLFFGNRVAIAYIVTAINPQAAISFDDARGITIQSQQYAGTQMIVSQAITDNMGRVAVRTKLAYITTGQNPMFRYCTGFSTMNWSAGRMTGLVNDAYPADQGYPFSRQTFEPSPLSRITEESVPGALFCLGSGHTTRYSYGADATLNYYIKTTINPNNDQSYEVSTLLDQVISQVSSNGGSLVKSETLYDDAGNAHEIHSPNYFDLPPDSTQSDWNTRQTFDYAKRLLTIQTGSQAPLKFIYDAAGNIRFTQDAQGAQTGTYNYTKYDVLSRQIEAGYLTGEWNPAQLQHYADSDPAWPSTPPTWRKKYTYDGDENLPNAIGRNTLILANNGSDNSVDVIEEFGYDIFGNTIVDTLTVNAYDVGRKNRLDYEYDDVGNITRIVYPQVSDGSRFTVYYKINSLSQITAISQNPDFTQLLGTFSCDAVGNPLETTIKPANGPSFKQKYVFNSPYWLTDIRCQDQGGTDLFKEALTYTEGGYGVTGYYDGMIASSSVQIGESSDKQDQFHYSYDSLGQVLNAQNTQQPACSLGEISHDANGNILNLTADGSPYLYEYNKGSQEVNTVRDTNNSKAIAQFNYDANGNAIQMTTAASGITSLHDLSITYDPATMLPVSVVDSNYGGTSVILSYGCRNERVMKQVSGGVATSSKKLYIRGTSAMPLMELTKEGSSQTEVSYIYGPSGLIAMRKGINLYYILKDHLGSVRVVLDQLGNTVASYQYLTYGALSKVQEPTSGFMPYLYTGQEYDQEFGLYNYRARLYSADLGRFLAIDPCRQYFSPYIYASNNPLLFIDPTGMFSLKSLFSSIAGILIGAVEIVIGVVIDVVGSVIVAIASFFSAGAALPLEVGVAALSGVFYGAGLGAITYSVFNTDDFSWKDYGIQMGIGAAVGLFSGGAGPLISAGAKSAQTGLTGLAQSARVMAGTVGGEGIGASITTGSLKAGAWIAEKGAAIAKLAVNGPATAGWQGAVKGIGTGIIKSEAIGITWNTASNLATGNDWDKGLGQTIFKSGLSGSIGGLQIRNRVIYGTT